MLTFYSDDHHLHHGSCELIDGQLMPCFEKPQRADHILARVQHRQLGEVMVVAVKGEHVTRLQACCCACIVRLLARMENAGNGQKGIEMAKFGGLRALMAPRKL